MLTIPQLDDLSYEKLFERARSRIPTLTQEWTDFNAHDPGITMLQMLAWLTDTLHYYMDATGEVHRLKYLKLLGIEPQQAVARCNLAIHSAQESEIIPRGARIKAVNTVFEVENTYTAVKNDVLAVYNFYGEKIRDITNIAGVDGTYAEIFTFDETCDNMLYIAFERPQSEELRLHIQMQENKKRNAFGDDFSLATLKWEYYNGFRWCEATLSEDTTGALLRSGFITLNFDDNLGELVHPMLNTGYYIRATVVENEYDELPKLGKITTNCAKVQQTDTITQAVIFDYNGENNVPIDYAISEQDTIIVAIKTENGYETWYEHTFDDDSLCEVVQGEYPWQRVINFSEERFGKAPEIGTQLMVWIVPLVEFDNMTMGITDGTANQRLYLGYNGLYNLRLATVRKINGRECYEIWEQCGDLNEASYADRVFYYDEANLEVVFGDGERGYQPKAKQKVVAVTVQLSEYESGNVIKGEINRFVTKGIEHVSAVNLEDAKGGKHKESSTELEAALEEKLRKINRAVTNEDYVKIVKSTPGLIIDHVNVITMESFAKYYEAQNKPNVVYLAVKPSSEREHVGLSNKQKQLIADYVEGYRLLTTEVNIIEPKYVKVNVFGRIALREDSSKAKEDVNALLHKLINYSETGGFGKDIAYGRVFSALELLPEVSSVLQLSFEIQGKGAKKNERFDIEVFPDALVYINNIDIEYV